MGTGGKGWYVVWVVWGVVRGGTGNGCIWGLGTGSPSPSTRSLAPVPDPGS